MKHEARVFEILLHIHVRYTSTSPLKENRKDENRKMWKLKHVKIVAAEIEITSWKVRAYGIFTRVGEVSEIERVSAANE